jgi:hypothetical protein
LRLPVDAFPTMIVLADSIFSNRLSFHLSDIGSIRRIEKYKKKSIVARYYDSLSNNISPLRRPF